MFKNSPDVDIARYSLADGTLIPLRTANRLIRNGWVKALGDGIGYRVLVPVDTYDPTAETYSSPSRNPAPDHLKRRTVGNNDRRQANLFLS